MSITSFTLLIIISSRGYFPRFGSFGTMRLYLFRISNNRLVCGFVSILFILKSPSRIIFLFVCIFIILWSSKSSFSITYSMCVFVLDEFLYTQITITLFHVRLRIAQNDTSLQDQTKVVSSLISLYVLFNVLRLIHEPPRFLSPESICRRLLILKLYHTFRCGL